MTEKNVNEREIALDILMEINEKEQYLHVLLNDALRKYQYLEKNERAFISRIVRGTIERRITLDYVINEVSTVKINKMKPLIRNLLRLSVYQMMYMQQVPVSAVCNEAVKIAAKRKFTNLKGFVNGVLRNIARMLPEYKLPDDYSIKYSISEELIEIIEKAYGTECLEDILEAFLSEHPISIITNTNRITAAQLEQRLISEGVKVKAAPYVENAFVISGFNYLDEIPSFMEGLFHIQDISSMLVGVIAGYEKDSTILDVCAAPGGKSIFAAICLNGTGRVCSMDVSEKKTMQIEENVERLGLDNVYVSVNDATEKYDEFVQKADYLITDVPCSGLGIIGRKPDIKYNVTKEKIKSITLLQRQIIDNVADYVKLHGIMMYSTCTLNPKENEENINYLIDKGFEPVDITDILPKQLLDAAKQKSDVFYTKILTDAKNGYITLLPGVFECDGFFVAKLKRVK